MDPYTGEILGVYIQEKYMDPYTGEILGVHIQDEYMESYKDKYMESIYRRNTWIHIQEK